MRLSDQCSLFAIFEKQSSTVWSRVESHFHIYYCFVNMLFFPTHSLCVLQQGTRYHKTWVMCDSWFFLKIMFFFPPTNIYLTFHNVVKISNNNIEMSKWSFRWLILLFSFLHSTVMRRTRETRRWVWHNLLFVMHWIYFWNGHDCNPTPCFNSFWRNYSA